MAKTPVVIVISGANSPTDPSALMVKDLAIGLLDETVMQTLPELLAQGVVFSMAATLALRLAQAADGTGRAPAPLVVLVRHLTALIEANQAGTDPLMALGVACDSVQAGIIPHMPDTGPAGRKAN